jgi:tetratricopeptide (TPR) repeat protein
MGESPSLHPVVLPRHIWPTCLVLLFAGVVVAAETPDPTTPINPALTDAVNQVFAMREGGVFQRASPVPPELPLKPNDRVQTGARSNALVRLADTSTTRLDQLTTIVLLPPTTASTAPKVRLLDGAIYFFSRAKAQELEVQTDTSTAILHGTEFVAKADKNGTLQIAMLDGEVELKNEAGSLILKSGESGTAQKGLKPYPTSKVEAANLIQWTLYYPGVIYLPDLAMDADEQAAVSDSLAAYREGDLLGALEKYPESHVPSTPAGRLYRDTVLLAVGRVDVAQADMNAIAANSPARRALQEVIAAVKLQVWPQQGDLPTASESLAESYYLQSQSRSDNHNLDLALAAAKHATELAPDFGYAWVRYAELEFSFGHIPEALQALEHGLQLTPRNAQAHALQGFLFSAQNRLTEARASFDEAINLDGALGNAWLGRGLLEIREGQDEAGLTDLQSAATLEPNRSVLHSYLGKAYSQAGQTKNAQRDFTRAKELDPHDPTPWLYAAVEDAQENRYNEAIDDLEKSIALNDNRSVFRSQFLLDEDQSIRGTNLASIYLNDGMLDQSEREAALAVDDDYSNAAAHLFLANVYNSLRDPTRINLRYESAWFDELLVSNLLAPVGGGPLSEFVSDQEYSKMFAHDGYGASSVTNYASDGELSEVASQYGTFGNFSYAVDTQYQHDDGTRPNNQLSLLETYAQVKYQVTPQDTAFFQTEYEDEYSGDLLQAYDEQAVATNISALTQNFHETQIPGLLLAGWNHAWSPENHTLLLIGRLEDQQVQTAQATTQAVVTRDVSSFTAGLPATPADFANPFSDPAIYNELHTLVGQGTIEAINTTPLDSSYEANFQTYSAELQQIITRETDTIILGSRDQVGTFTTMDALVNQDAALAALFDSPAADQDYTVDFQRISVYAYNTWRPTDWLSITVGVAYDSLQYPDNFRSPPINNQQQSLNGLSPKVGFILRPTSETVVRGAYMEAISGASFDESVSLEPSEVDGFTQAFRSLASESLIGSVAGNKYKLWGLSVEQKLPTRTYLGIGYDDRQQILNQTLGVFDFLDSQGNYPNEILPSSLDAEDGYHEQVISATVNQLVGKYWSLGAKYSYTRSTFDQEVPELQAAALTAAPANVASLEQNAETHDVSGLQELQLTAMFNHPSGFFFQLEGDWYMQSNEGTPTPEPGDSFWQFNLYGGYRFDRNQCEVSCGLLNLTSRDYQLSPLTPYEELPRQFTLAVRVKLSL